MLTASSKLPRPTAAYLKLIEEFPLRALRNDRDLDAAAAVIDRLVVKKKLSAAESDYLEVLEMLVSKYENTHHRPEPLPDRELLAHLMSEHGLTQKALERETGIAHSTISDVLRGHRKLTRAHIGTLARFFRVSTQTFQFT
jgi:antitoxin component HigA of HigAB toxin-antitoxin module